MKKFNKPEPKMPINSKIVYNTLRVVDGDTQLGIMSKSKALDIAQSRGLDLVVITESAKPPVAKIIDANNIFMKQNGVKKKPQNDNVKVVLKLKRFSFDQILVITILIQN